ncbi:solute carrier family 15 member 4-like [Halichondria panicea]|uniref:solute carrier family 15 member 4-like n=1 Tax=Halichondria panicea TaxID=6063 RepID=UPI00312B5F65
MADPSLSMSSSESGTSTKRVVFASRALTNDTEPGVVNSQKCLIKQSVAEDMILRRSQYLKPKCRVRKISSKAAVLVLIWTVLVNCTFGSLDNFMILFKLNYELIPTVVPGVMFVLVALLSGYIADNFIGRYRSTKIAFILLFVTSILQCILVIVRQSIMEYSPSLSIGLVTFTSSLGYGSVAILFVTLSQIGLDQITDSSVSNITSFISWFVASVYFGNWFSDFSYNTGSVCFGINFETVWSLLFVVCMSIVLISDLFLTPKWLIIEPKCPQCMKMVYHVLKYAAKHKSPTNRSALTYWEEDIPSRIDLGKTKYGGPFTVEQVEDVKTLLRILALTAPLWLSFFSFQMQSNIINILKADSSNVANTTDSQRCHSHVIKFFTYDLNLLPSLFLVVHELVIFPLFGHLTPSSIRRIGVSFLLIVITSFLCVLICVYFYFNHDVHIALVYIHALCVAIIYSILYPSLMEFVSAQSPYNMRGLLQGYLWCIVIISYPIAELITTFSFFKDGLAQHILIFSSFITVVTLVGFVLFCLLARWYKRRERDDIVNVHTLVEEVYDRYISNRSVL